MGEKKWLPHVTNEITIGSRNRLSAYLIALEGWRRGLKLVWYSRKVKKAGIHAPGRLFSLSSSERTHFFYNSKGDLTSDKAQRITGNKDLTKQWLSKAGVPVPAGRRFTEKSTDKEIIKYAGEISYPVVLKPSRGYQGIGVFANLKNEKEFSRALIHLKYEMNYSDVIVEKYIEGTEYRVFVIGNQVVGAIEKIPPNIIGDGDKTIKQLIDKKNKMKRKNPHLFRKPIKVDLEVENCIKAEGYTLESILKKGEILYLRKKNSLSSGGDPIDATDKISENTKTVVINALNAIPNLAQGGIDVMVNQEADNATIIEINAIAMIGSHLFPEKGEARDVPAAIIDYYFPESRENKGYNTHVHFDLRSILRPLISKTAKEVEVTPAPFWENEHSTKYIVEGKVQQVGYRRWIRRKALESDLYGYVRNLNNGSVEVVVAGEKDKVINFKTICKQGSRKSSVTDVKVDSWDKPIKVGFEIKVTEKKKKKESKNKKMKKIQHKSFISRIKKRFIRVLNKNNPK